MGDVGDQAREELSLLVKGGNYEWPFREGTLGAPPQQPVIGERRAPLFDYAHEDGNNCIIGDEGNDVLVSLMQADLAKAAGVQLTHVPYRGSADSLNDLLAGNIQMMAEINPLIVMREGEGVVMADALLRLAGDGAAARAYLDGELDAGPAPGGGFLVRASLPVVPTVRSVPSAP